MSTLHPRRVGFFRELRHGDPAGPSLRASVEAAPHPDEPPAIGYLKTGAVLAAASTAVGDALDPSRRRVVGLAIHTDGVWVWPSDLAYYVATYHVRLPEELLEHMRSSAWVPPPLSRDELTALADAYRGSGSR